MSSVLINTQRWRRMAQSFPLTSKRFLSTRRKHIGRPETPVTKKERIRSREVPPDTTAEEFMDRAESNLSFIQDSLYSFWRGKGDPRPARKGVKMDFRWWFWSVNVALLPAYCITLYCEFIGRPQMKEFHAKKTEEARRKAMGLDFDEEKELELLKEMGSVKDLLKIKKREGTSTTSTSQSDTQSSEVVTKEALEERVDALETQLLLLRAAERRRMNRAYQSGVESRHQDRMLADLLQKKETEVPEELGPIDKAMIQLAENAQTFVTHIMEQGGQLLKSVTDKLALSEEREKNQTRFSSPQPETTINAVDDSYTFARHSADALSSNNVHTPTTTENNETEIDIIKAAEQAAGVQEHQPDLWTKSWAVITGASSGSSEER